MTRIRPAAVAGMFYPDDPAQLRQTIEDYVHNANVANATPPKAIIAPHAGYIYSGPIAASVYAALKPLAGKITRVILLGPAHRVPFHGLAASSANAFATPLGHVAIDQEALNQIADLAQVKLLDPAHAQEHSLEVHLPFLQVLLKDFTLVPLVVGDATAQQVSEVLERLWGGEETLIVISSDLSHYHDYHTAQQMDRRTSYAIEQLAPDEIEFHDACGRIPIQGLLLCARDHGLHAKTIDLRNSGDTAGNRDQVVGYGAYAFH